MVKLLLGVPFVQSPQRALAFDSLSCPSGGSRVERRGRSPLPPRTGRKKKKGTTKTTFSRRPPHPLRLFFFSRSRRAYRKRNQSINTSVLYSYSIASIISNLSNSLLLLQKSLLPCVKKKHVHPPTTIDHHQVLVLSSSAYFVRACMSSLISRITSHNKSVQY